MARVVPGGGTRPRRRADARRRMTLAMALCGRLERAPAAHAAAVHAAARGQLQSIIAAALIEMGDFEVVDEAVACSARHDEGRARHGAASRNAAAVSETALVSAPAVRFDAPCQRAFCSCAI